MLTTDRTKDPTSGPMIAYENNIDWTTNRILSQTRNGVPMDASYDASGNMLSLGDTGYNFDPRNRLVEVWRQIPGAVGLTASYDYDSSGYRVRAATEDAETFYVRDQSGKLLSEFRRGAGDPDPSENPPTWNKDYIYALGQTISMVKNETPETPGRPWATGVTSQGLTLHWDTVSDPDVAVYKVYRAVTTGTPPNTTTVETNTELSIPPFDDTFDPSIDDPETVIEYQVQVSDTARNWSAKSPALVVRPFDNVVPAAPVITAGVAQDRAVSLSWDAVSDDDLWGYRIERLGPWIEDPQAPGPPPGFWTSLIELAVPTTSYFNFNLSNGSSYRYRVRAIDSAGNISALPESPINGEDEITITPMDLVPPSQPFGVTAQPDLVADAIVVRWEAVLDSDLDIYEIARGSTILSIDGSYTELTDESLAPRVSYYYKVRAVDSSGNPSPWSAEVSAIPRDASIDVPTLAAPVFIPDENGTPTKDPYVYNGILELDDDIIGVQLAWNELTAPTGYNVYRSDSTSDVYGIVADLNEAGACDGTNCSYFDATVTEDEHTYYIVAVEGEFEGPASQPKIVFDDFTTPVNNVAALDGRGQFTTQNMYIRKVTVAWSRVPESALAGYHVYRRCMWTGGMFGEQLRDLSCTNSWERLTASPITVRTFTDFSAGVLRNDYSYAVRPVSTYGEEGPMPTKIVLAELESNSIPQPHVAPAFGYSMEGKHPGPYLNPHDEQVRVDAIAKGTDDSWGAPAKPVLIDKNDAVEVGEVVCRSDDGRQTGDVFYYGTTDCDQSGYQELPDQSNARKDWEWKWSSDQYLEEGPYTSNATPFGLYAYIDWLPNTESDLAGYYVEMAGSTEGPWVRLNNDPIAWWETHFDARLWARPDCASPPCMAWLGPNCAVFQVLAVDDNGLESEPSEPFQVAPVAEQNSYEEYVWGSEVSEQDCSPVTPTLDAPENVMAENDGTTAVRVSWDQVSGAHAYRVYRLVIPETHMWYFYLTGTVDDATGCPDGVCEFIEDGNDDISQEGPCNEATSGPNCGIGLLDAFYVTAIDNTPYPGMPQESMRSEMVLWNANLGGYARLRQYAPVETWDALASLEPGPYNGPWCEASSLTCEEDASVSPVAIAKAGYNAAWPNAAPLLTLGQGSNPPFKIYDLHVDHLGSTRVVSTDVSGGPAAIVSQHDFLPFGEEIAPMFDYNTKMFTGHERDEETGLDYMFARYYSSGLGRFLSADPVTIKAQRLRIPQRLNLYTYAANNPIKYFDPTGEDVSVFVVGPGTGPKEQYGHAAIFVSTENYSGGISYGGNHGFAKGKDSFVASYNADARTVTEYKLNVTPEQEAKLAEFVKANPDGAVDQDALGADSMITENCTTAIGNALEASGVVAEGEDPPGSGVFLDTPSELQDDLEEGGDNEDLVKEKEVHEPKKEKQQK